MSKYSPNHPLILTLKNRIWKYTEDLSFFTDEDCWNWIGNMTDRGYGTISFLGKPFRVHRLTYWIYVDFCQSGLIFKSEIIIRHKCDNPSCINPKHLLKGTQLDNVNDRETRNRSSFRNKIHCPFGHEYTKENTYINPNTGDKYCRKCHKKHSREYRMSLL